MPSSTRRFGSSNKTENSKRVNKSQMPYKGFSKFSLKSSENDEKLNFYLCHITPESGSPLRKNNAHIHFHEYFGIRPNRHLCGGEMIEKDEKLGETYGPIELAIECAKAKAGGDAYRFNRIRAVMLDIRPVIETELRRKDKGMKPPPDEVLEKLLTPMPGEPVTVVTQTVWKKPKVKTRVQ
jgi:hypothetical protein